MCKLGALPTAAPALGHRLSNIACWPFKSRLLVSDSPPALAEWSLTDLQSQTGQGLIFPVQIPGWGSPMWGLIPWLLREDSRACDRLLMCGGKPTVVPGFP